MKKSLYKKAKPYIYSTPSLILCAAIVVFPILYTLYISMTNMSIYHWFDPEFVWFSNYANAILVFDSGFVQALLLTILWTVLSMVLQLVLAYLLATLLNRPELKLRKLYKTLLMFPWAMPGYVSILLWQTGIFNTEFGLLNQWMSALGLDMVSWLSTNVSAFICCTIVNLWLALPFMITIMDGALQSIDKSYYEFARLEGANFVQKSKFITIPMMRVIIGPAVLITIFTTFKQFDVIYLLTLKIGSQTGAEIHTVLTYAYYNAFITHNYGYSSAVSIIIFIMMIAFSFLVNKDLRRAKNVK